MKPTGEEYEVLIKYVNGNELKLIGKRKYNMDEQDIHNGIVGLVEEV